ncbi:3518_t:CDS:2 [Diversispora eburnea]|uniref:3518_t:CDS:1 n=1 Tax=Diversispora eburnea TaxID=1213867 RepID=A0A9N9BPI9_9GLOM|nr:3518_t:CDS:2 [Diversispora eburnea]
MKLKDTIKQSTRREAEYEARIKKLEQKDKEKTNLITKLEQNIKIPLSELRNWNKASFNNSNVKSDNDTKGIDQSSVDTASTKMENSKYTPEQMDLQCDDTPASNITDNTSNSDVYLGSLTQETKVSLSRNCSVSTICAKPKSLDDKGMDNFLDRVHKENVNVKASSYHEAFQEEKLNHNEKIKAILTGSSKVTSQNIVDLFRVAMKVRQKESLCWYCYYKAYENQVSDIKFANNINDQLARTIVYNEIKSLLPLPIQVTYSASAISNLKDIQIQNIIHDFFKKSNDMNCQNKKIQSNNPSITFVTSLPVNTTLFEKTRKTTIPKSQTLQNIKQKQKSNISSQNIIENSSPTVNTYLSPFSVTIKLLEEEDKFKITTISLFTSSTLELPVESTLLYSSLSYFSSSQSSTVTIQVDPNT